MTQQSKQMDEMILEIIEKFSPEKKKEFLEKFRRLKLNILTVGGTGVGKSSTINAILNQDKAKVGKSSDPETQDIQCYEFSKLIIWDTPGLGDNPVNDKRYKQQLTKKLKEIDENGLPVIDLVLLILDGASRDYSAAYTLLSDVIVPNLDKDAQDRLLIAINKSDKALDDEWDYELGQPTETLLKFLDGKVESTRCRIKEATGLNITPIYYSAGNDKRIKSYNLAKLLSYILDKIPSKKRILIAKNLNQNRSFFERNDNKDNYQKKSEESFIQSILDTVKEIIEHPVMEKLVGLAAMAVPAAISFFKKR